MNYKQIQDTVISKYKIDICDGSKCKNDWKRTHAHVRERRVCKWEQRNSFQSTFTLLHEIGHIMTDKGYYRRAEQEFFATEWAIAECLKYELKIPYKTISIYQRYIDIEKDRGIRRGAMFCLDLKLSALTKE